MNFLTGGGEAGALISAYDWSCTPLGALESWPQSLRTAVNLLLRSPVPVVMLWGEDGIMLYNDAYSVFAGRRHPELLGSKVREGWPEVADFNDNVMRVGLAGGTLTYKDQELTLYRHGRAEPVCMDLNYSPVVDESGEPAGVICVLADTTDRVRAERRREALLKLDERLRSAGEAGQVAYASAELLGEALGACRVGYGDIDPQAGIITGGRTWSLPGLPDVAGLHEFNNYGTYITELRAGRVVAIMDVDKDPRTVDRAASFRAIGIRACLDVPVMETGGVVAEVFVHSTTPRVWHEEDANLAHEIAERTRATIARKKAEQELRELNETLERRVEERTAELMQAEEALRQAQKMEAVGQLTGGIAHDFNNLLAGISGSLELLEKRLAERRTNGLERYIGAAQTSARRAAALTQRLLAFSRRQTLDPQPTNVNKLIAGMEELIRRTVGPSIELEVVGAGGLWITKIDAAQLESALLNLAINARDAMPKGGRITVETANKWLDERGAKSRELTPGQYLSICVSDTGAGMTPQVIERAFDPFFTTKPLGQGTGLGLSMIHGFVRQSGGQVRIYSELGKGTTMCLYLPRFAGEVATEESETATELPSGTGEIVLVIDDEPVVRMLIVEVLSEAGYLALEAEDGATGLKLLQSSERIDLLITDVGLPGGMNGRQVADAARTTRPNLKVLFVTGYAENAVVGNGHLDPGMAVITKPFVMAELGNKVREMIDES